MLKVKVTIPGLPNNLSLQEYTGSLDNFIDGVQSYVNSDFDEPDVWLVFDDGVDGHSAIIDPANIFFMTAEICYPIGRFDDERGQRYLSQFAKLFTCHDIFDERTHFTRPFNPWMMNANHGSSTYWDNLRGRNYFRDVTSFDKPHDLSVICSAKAFTPEHYARLKFVTRLKEDLKDRLHWYGNGINPLPDKFDGIAPYRYHLAIENRFGRDIVSEKLYDSFLGLAYPIYHGAPNIHDYYNEWMLSSINIYDYKRSRNQILELIDSDVAERSQKDLIRAKQLVVDQDNWVVRMAMICRLYSLPHKKQERITLRAF
jgi:hypothetical protein